MTWVLVIAASLAVFFYLACVLPTKWLKVERVHVPLQVGLKILQISDVHAERNRIHPQRLRRLIDEERPDLICLTGDFLDTRPALLLLVPLLKMIQSTKIPTYAVLGNHDYKLKMPDELKALLRAFGVTLLENETIVVGGMNLVGIDDFCSRHSDEKAFDGIVAKKPVVVMTHDPTLTMFMKHSFDYLFAGHLHGRQFALPFVFKFNDMGPLAASGVYKGLHRCERGLFYISKGVGQSGVNLRFLVRSEVTIHEL